MLNYGYIKLMYLHPSSFCIILNVIAVGFCICVGGTIQRGLIDAPLKTFRFISFTQSFRLNKENTQRGRVVVFSQAYK